jgi:uncharacterized protein
MLRELAAGLHESRGIAHKRDIAAVMSVLAPVLPDREDAAAVLLGDDCAAIADGDGYLLFAIEGFLNEFVEKDPWFAGYCGVMVNVSDICAMGGRPIAVVDALWSRGGERGRTILEGMVTASRIYGVPIVGGHSNGRNDREQLAVAVLGRARQLLTSFDARPGDILVAAVDLRGRYREPYPYWDASTHADGARLRGDLEVLAQVAEAGLCVAAKDISMAGVIGTALMLLECSGLGAVIDVQAVPRPEAAALPRWLLSMFPSYGFLLSVAGDEVAAVVERFTARDIACAAIGLCDDTGVVRLSDGEREEQVWDFAESALIGCGPRAALAQ